MTNLRSRRAAVAFTLVSLMVASACSGPAQPTSATPAAPKPATNPTTPATVALSSPAAGASPALASGSPSPAPKPAAAAPSPSAPTAAPGRWNFDSDPAGGLPNGAQAFAGQWAVRNESDAPSQPNALCQTGQTEFPAVQLDAGPYTDLVLTTKFKPISGREDQAAGDVAACAERARLLRQAPGKNCASRSRATSSATFSN